MKVTFLRHGITEGNARRLYYGSADIPLLSEGIRDLEGKRAAGGYPTAGRYYTSGMRRTEQTFSILYGDLPHGTLPGFREMDFGIFEMKSHEELQGDPAYQAWITGDVEAVRCPGGESGHLVTERALAEMEKLLAAGEDTVCVIHGGVIGGLMVHWFRRGGRYDWTPPPGCGWQVTFEHGAPVSCEKVPFQWENRTWSEET